MKIELDKDEVNMLRRLVKVKVEEDEYGDNRAYVRLCLKLANVLLDETSDYSYDH